MRDSLPKTIFLKDYQVPDFFIDTTDLHFTLNENNSVVRARLAIRRNTASKNHLSDLHLMGQELELLSVAVDGKSLSETKFQTTSESLIIPNVPDQFTLETIVEISPQNNTSLEGLYKSNTLFCTQCEAEGFRKITYYLDRPDVMSIYTTTIVADRNKYPVLLSNGNNTENGVNEDGTHWARWEDPFRKPCYLFALVAGDLESVEGKFTTQSGNNVDLRIFVEAKDTDKCEHAMSSLIEAMRWDEDVYGREYDLNIFNIVAVDDFNMGAMENKSLNIFNTSCVLANPETTTDAGFQRVEGIVAHEYFHNWSGNRVTCRDWFQLSLKEGFTVYRDAEFSSDMGSRTVKRIEDVSLLRTIQFSEDAGPMAHPIRPDSFIEISNFYTVTIYEKGAEIVRMIAHLLGADGFRKGSDLYFDRHDGQAVTCEDFVKSMEDASGIDLSQFRRWYSQAGTPLLTVVGSYDSAAQTYTLDITQSCGPTPGQNKKEPFHIPLLMSLIGVNGEIPLKLLSSTMETSEPKNEIVLDVTEPKQQFVFGDIGEDPVPSLLRGFSAPVKLSFDYSCDQLMFLIVHDTDGFCKWDAAQQLGVRALNDMVSSYRSGEAMVVDHRLVDAYRIILADDDLDAAMVALILTLPSEAYISELSDEVDVQAIHAARNSARTFIATELREEFWKTYKGQQSNKEYQPSCDQIAQRSLKNCALDYLMLLEGGGALDDCLAQFSNSSNMTDVLKAFISIINSPYQQQKETVIVDFYRRWENEPLVINQWFMAQAICSSAGTLDDVIALMDHPAFDITNPNKARALIGSFCSQNSVNFHQTDGRGYQFLANQIIVLDGINPQIAS
ncbi:MAG: aminopeptidase N, partial [Gammaproteobacteria bacterium]